LVAYDFGVKYVGKHNAEFLMQVLQDNNCSILIDWTDSIFCETLLAWDYKNGMANLSMPVYIEKFHPPNPNIAPLSRAPQIMDKNTMDKRS